MNKIIFLDFDGVITTYASKWEIDNEKCLLVKKICDETGAKIVISSSWRYSTVEKTIDQYPGLVLDEVRSAFEEVKAEIKRKQEEDASKPKSKKKSESDIVTE